MRYQVTEYEGSYAACDDQFNTRYQAGSKITRQVLKMLRSAAKSFRVAGALDKPPDHTGRKVVGVLEGIVGIVEGSLATAEASVVLERRNCKPKSYELTSSVLYHECTENINTNTYEPRSCNVMPRYNTLGGSARVSLFFRYTAIEGVSPDTYDTLGWKIAKVWTALGQASLDISVKDGHVLNPQPLSWAFSKMYNTDFDTVSGGKHHFTIGDVEKWKKYIFPIQIHQYQDTDRTWKGTEMRVISIDITKSLAFIVDGTTQAPMCLRYNNDLHYVLGRGLTDLCPIAADSCKNSANLADGLFTAFKNTNKDICLLGSSWSEGEA